MNQHVRLAVAVTNGRHVTASPADQPARTRNGGIMEPVTIGQELLEERRRRRRAGDPRADDLA